MDRIEFYIHIINDCVWGPGMLVLLLGTGCYLMLKLEFIPLKNLKFALECALGFHARNELEDKSEIKNKALKGGVSSFSSLTTELAATIGTGNIVGVATAMLLGGPGALLWMMVSALIGMATKLVESMLSVKYRSVNDRGEYAGGPMYTMVKAFPNKRLGSILALFFAVFAIICFASLKTALSILSSEFLAIVIKYGISPSNPSEIICSTLFNKFELILPSFVVTASNVFLKI